METTVSDMSLARVRAVGNEVSVCERKQKQSGKAPGGGDVRADLCVKMTGWPCKEVG